jgi:hypothetical protein
MRRWLAVCLLLISSSGCALMDELGVGFDSDYAPSANANSGCNAPPPIVAQTQEPELAIASR